MPGAPREPALSLRRGVRRVAGVQALLTALVAAVFGWRDGLPAALAAAYGGAVAILISVWLGWRLRRAGGQTGGLAALYSGAVLRYAATVALLALGLGVLPLAPLPLVAAFGLTQFGFLANLRRDG